MAGTVKVWEVPAEEVATAVTGVVVLIMDEAVSVVLVATLLTDVKDSVVAVTNEVAVTTPEVPVKVVLVTVAAVLVIGVVVAVTL